MRLDYKLSSTYGGRLLWMGEWTANSCCTELAQPWRIRYVGPTFYEGRTRTPTAVVCLILPSKTRRALSSAPIRLVGTSPTALCILRWVLRLPGRIDSHWYSGVVSSCRSSRRPTMLVASISWYTVVDANKLIRLDHCMHQRRQQVHNLQVKVKCQRSRSRSRVHAKMLFIYVLV